MIKAYYISCCRWILISLIEQNCFTQLATWWKLKLNRLYFLAIDCFLVNVQPWIACDKLPVKEASLRLTYLGCRLSFLYWFISLSDIKPAYSKAISAAINRIILFRKMVDSMFNQRCYFTAWLSIYGFNQLKIIIFRLRQ